MELDWLDFIIHEFQIYWDFVSTDIAYILQEKVYSMHNTYMYMYDRQYFTTKFQHPHLEIKGKYMPAARVVAKIESSKHYQLFQLFDIVQAAAFVK